MANGYVRIRAVGHPLAHKDGYVLEHRLVLYQAGVEVRSNDHVHHINGDKRDNRLENLAVVSNSEHGRQHNKIGSTVKNQYGTFVVLTPQERREKNRERSYRNYLKRRDVKDSI